MTYKKKKNPRYIFLHSNVSKPTENIKSLAFCLSILAHLLQFLIQQIYTASGETGCVQCAWSADLGICSTADLQRDLLKEEAKQMDDPCAFRSCYLNPGGLLKEAGLVTIDLPILSCI